MCSGCSSHGFLSDGIAGEGSGSGPTSLVSVSQHPEPWGGVMDPHPTQHLWVLLQCQRCLWRLLWPHPINSSINAHEGW